MVGDPRLIPNAIFRLKDMLILKDSPTRPPFFGPACSPTPSQKSPEKRKWTFWVLAANQMVAMPRDYTTV
jgi:hypothetical protein